MLMKSALKYQSAITSALAVALAALFSECADLDLDRAHQNGNLSDSDYYRLKAERETARRQQSFMEQQAAQQRNNQIMSDYMRSINNTPTTPMFSTPFLQSTPKAAPAQQQQGLPSGLELDQIQKGQGVFTGRSQLGQDGKLWYEYRTYTGSTYWSPAHLALSALFTSAESHNKNHSASPSPKMRCHECA